MKLKALPLLFLFLVSCNFIFAQLPWPLTPERPEYRNPHSFFMRDSVLNKKKVGAVAGLFVATYGGIYTSLGIGWYKGTERTAFHWFDDLKEWKQVDKFGHVMGAYQGGRAMIQLMKWSGCKKKSALIWGGLSSFAMLSTLEIFDGFSKSYGASASDLAANFIGSALAVGNEWLWNEQRIQIKISWHKTDYPKSVDDGILGDNWTQFLKDYNGHTHWLSFRVRSFLPEGDLKQIWPRWLNVAIGAGAEGMIGNYDDPLQAWKKHEFRRYHLGLDIDLSQIRTRIGILNWIFGTINFIHIPAPSFEFSKHGVKFRALYF